MFQNYLAAALRNLARNGQYAGITIAGLAVAFAAAILIGLYVRDELSYDRWVPGHQQIFLVRQRDALASSPNRITEDTTPAAISDLLKLGLAIDPICRARFRGSSGFPPALRRVRYRTSPSAPSFGRIRTSSRSSPSLPWRATRPTRWRRRTIWS